MKLPETPEFVISPHLTRAEKLLWHGRPRQGIFLRPNDAFLIPFSLFWGGFAVFWEYNAMNSEGPIFFSFWGIPFVLVGLYVIVGRFFVDARQRSKTFYGLTNERVVIVSGIISRNVKSLQLRTLSEMTLSERPDGSGTITFGPPGAWWSGLNWPGASKDSSPVFDSIQSARVVYDQIRLVQTGASG